MTNDELINDRCILQASATRSLLQQTSLHTPKHQKYHYLKVKWGIKPFIIRISSRTSHEDVLFNRRRANSFLRNRRNQHPCLVYHGKTKKPSFLNVSRSVLPASVTLPSHLLNVNVLKYFNASTTVFNKLHLHCVCGEARIWFVEGWHARLATPHNSANVSERVLALQPPLRA